MKSRKMENILPGAPGGAKTAEATVGGSLKISRFGDSGNTISIPPDIGRLAGLSTAEALQEAAEELGALLVVYQNLGGVIAGVTLPDGQMILGQRHLIMLPACKEGSGTYSLYVPECTRKDVPE